MSRAGSTKVGHAFGSIWWLARHPRHFGRDFGWVLRQIGLSRFAPRDASGNQLGYVDPRFLEQFGRAMDNPQTVPAADAVHLRNDDTVIGVAISGAARAYPWWQIDEHHCVNDVVGEQPVFVALCEMCSTGLVLDPTLSTRRLMFDLGHHYLGTNAYVDRETGSTWAPYSGAAILGPLRGEQLKLLPSFQTSWGEWKELHPETDALNPSIGQRHGHGHAYTLGSPGVGPGFRATIARWDERLEHNCLVLGVTEGGSARAYPLEMLRDVDTVLNDEFVGIAIVVLASSAPGGSSAIAYRRTVCGKVLTFAPAGDHQSHAVAIDLDTESCWNLDGLAISGRLRGARLDYVPSHVSEWYVWAANYPDIDIFQSPA